MSKKYDAGVKEYRDTYWTPEYVPLDTDLLACFKCTGQEHINGRREGTHDPQCERHACAEIGE